MKQHMVKDVMAHKPCEAYPRERVEQLWGNRASLSCHEILDLDIPVADLIWAILRLRPDVVVEFARGCAERAAAARADDDADYAAIPAHYAADAAAAAARAAYAADDAAAACAAYAADAAAAAARAAYAADDAAIIERQRQIDHLKELTR